jgi:hypothetical protein
MKSIIGKLVGMSFYKNATSVVKQLTNDTTVLLVREPRNKYDPNAIGVYMKLGHINRDVAMELAPLADVGKRGLGGPGFKPENHICFFGSFQWEEVLDGSPPKGPTVVVLYADPTTISNNGKKETSDDDEIPF